MSTCEIRIFVLLCGATQLLTTAYAASDLGDGTRVNQNDDKMYVESKAPSGQAVLSSKTVSSAQDTKIATELAGGKGLSPNELIARGQYQMAVDELLQKLKGARDSGMESERAALLSNLGMAYNKLGRYADAESSLEKALQVWKVLGLAGTGRCARTLNNLANVFLSQRRYAKAEDMFRQALALYRSALAESLASEKASTQNQLDVAVILSNLGLTEIWQGRFSEAELLLRESLEIQHTVTETRFLPMTLNNLALAFKLQGRLEPAVGMYTQAIQAWQANAGYEKPEVAVGLHNLAMVESALGRTSEAERHFKQALDIVDTALPAAHPTRIAILDGYGELLKKLRRKHEAKQVQALARAMRAHHDHENFQDLTVSVQQIAR